MVIIKHLLQFNYQGSVLHWFMYFAKDSFSKNGIWFHGSLLAIVRGSNILPNITYVNAQVHQTDTKVHAGFEIAEYTNTDLLSYLYPRRMTVQVDEKIIKLSTWRHGVQYKDS